MDWLRIGTVSTNEWTSEETAAFAKDLNGNISSLLGKQRSLDEEEARLKSVPAEELNSKILGLGTRIRDKRLELLLEEIPIRRRILEFYQRNKADHKAWQAAVNPDEIEMENALFLIKHGWVDPASPEVKAGMIGGYVTHFNTACRCRTNWREAWKVKAKSYMNTPEETVKQEQAISTLQQMLTAIRDSTISF